MEDSDLSTRNPKAKLTPYKKNVSTLKMATTILSILLLSLAIFSTTQVRLMAQPNAQPAKEPMLQVTASGGKIEPMVGKTNVFGPGGLFPFTGVYKCANDLPCGVDAGTNAKFTGTFEEGNKHNGTQFTVDYTSPISYGPLQLKGHTYEIKLIDTKWNGTGVAMQTRDPEFANMVNNVGFNQIQHGIAPNGTNVDRQDVPLLYDAAYLYGQVLIKDKQTNQVVCHCFSHVMVASVMDPNNFFRSLKGDSKLGHPVILLDAMNFPSGRPLPPSANPQTPKTWTVDQAESYTPLKNDPSLKNPPPIDYGKLTIKAPEPQSTVWPVDNPKEDLLFTFLFFPAPTLKYISSSNMTSTG
jgi:hypothetical protein